MIDEFTAQRQIESFWNLIQTSDESVQEGLYILLYNKYSNTNHHPNAHTQKQPTFIELKGILRSEGSEQTDKQLLEEYLEEKYRI